MQCLPNAFGPRRLLPDMHGWPQKFVVAIGSTQRKNIIPVISLLHTAGQHDAAYGGDGHNHSDSDWYRAVSKTLWTKLPHWERVQPWAPRDLKPSVLRHYRLCQPRADTAGNEFDVSRLSCSPASTISCTAVVLLLFHHPVLANSAHRDPEDRSSTLLPQQ